MTAQFERIDSAVVWKGKIAEVRIERFRHHDGEVVKREVIRHPGAVAVVAHDDEQVWLVRQPREATGEPDLLELPAGKLDIEGEEPLDTAKRELAEEIGKAARDWRELTSFYTSPGFTDERVIVYHATGLSDAGVEPDESERIDVVQWPLERLAEAIESCHDSKSLVGLLWFAAERSGTFDS
jgi:8-oxo-dGTP pyrophosphatase MutT (NUDIX family)